MNIGQDLNNIKNHFETCLKDHKKHTVEKFYDKYTMYKYFSVLIDSDVILNNKKIAKKLLNEIMNKIKIKTFPLKKYHILNVEIFRLETHYIGEGIKGLIIYERRFPFNIIDMLIRKYKARKQGLYY